MFRDLLESNARRERRGKVAMVSLATHAAAVGLAVIVTGVGDRPRLAAEPVPVVLYQRMPEPPGAPSPRGVSPRREATTRTPTPPRIPVPNLSTTSIGIPIVDPSLRPVVGEDFGASSGIGLAGTSAPAGGDVGAAGEVLSLSAVERAAVPLPGAPGPRYPVSLERSGTEGRVVVQFVVDTAGRVEAGTLRILHSDHVLFTAAVRAAVARLRFRPAEAAGRRVRQLVELPFEFAIER